MTLPHEREFNAHQTLKDVRTLLDGDGTSLSYDQAWKLVEMVHRLTARTLEAKAEMVRAVQDQAIEHVLNKGKGV